MLTRLARFVSALMSALARRLQRNFYLYLAALLTLCVLLDASVFHVGVNMRQKAFDLMVRSRFIVPKPDPDIVIVDVNEASLAALAAEYGRWPWPRQVFGEFIEQIEKQQPKAVVFDILFSDADVFNPDSDAYFNETVAATDNTFFPFLRLAEAHDALSQVKPSMIPGVAESAPGKGNPAATVAVVLPHFDAALKAKRLGTHNIYPDADGIVREYRLWQDKDGWRLPSLPLLVGDYAQMNSLPLPQDMLINWRGGPFSYRSVSFSDVYRDLTAKKPQRPADEFTGKIVIIGSTAPSLFDVKATAMAKAHPGVEILATAIDNVKHRDYLYFWRGALPYVLVSLLLIWLTAAAFYRNVDRDRFNKVFSGSQIGLLAVSYIGINLTNTYADFTGPVTWALAYFSVAKIYALATDRAMQRRLAYDADAEGVDHYAALLLIQFESDEPLGESLLKKLGREIEAGGAPNSVEALKGTQGGLWGLFTDMLVVGWSCHQEATAEVEAIHLEAAGITADLPRLLAKAGLAGDVRVRHRLHQGLLAAGLAPAPQWRTLFAEAVLELEQVPTKKETT